MRCVSFASRNCNFVLAYPVSCSTSSSALSVLEGSTWRQLSVKPAGDVGQVGAPVFDSDTCPAG